MGPEQHRGERQSHTSLPTWIRGKIDGNCIAILWLLQSYYPECYPSIATLQKESGFGRSKVMEILQRLKSAGYITWAQRLRENGSQSSNLYVLRLNNHEPPSWAKAASDMGSDNRTPRSTACQGPSEITPEAAQARPIIGRPQVPGTAPRPIIGRPEGDLCFRDLDNLQVLETQNQKPKTQEPPSKAPQGAVLPSVAHRGGPDVDGWMGGQPTTTRPLQQPQEAASTASSGSPYRHAPQDGLPGPQSSQLQPEAPAEQPKPRAKAPARPRDPYASRDLPESAIPDDLLGVQQELRAWWSVKPRGRTQVAFEAACKKLRRYSLQEQQEMLEKAVIGGHQGLYEPASASRPGLRSGGGDKPSLTQQLRTMGLIQ